MSSTSSPDGSPNPWSREGANPEPAQPVWPSYPGQSASDPYVEPPSSRPSAPDPGFDRQPIPPYGSPAGSATGYPSASDPYGPTDPYAAPTPGPAADPYASNPYAVNPYQPSYGGYGSYGVIPVQHPRAVLAMVLGIISVVTGTFCIGGVVGIPALIIGRQVRREIDAEPGRYAGRGMATAGIVLGIVALAMMAVTLILVIIGVMVDPN